MTNQDDQKPVADKAAQATRREGSVDSTPNYHICCPYCHERESVPEQAFFQEIRCAHCGSTFHLASAASTADRGVPPTHVGPYVLLDQLGYGQHGSVWKARDTKLDRVVALKIPRRTNLSESELEMFFREARAAAQLRHANIVTVHDVGRDGACAFIANEFVQGANLREWLSTRRITFREAAEICCSLAEALEHAHETGVIHRDLKPANIMIDLAGQPRIMDFGLARRETGEVTVTLEGQIVGTPAYMSPEQAVGEGHQADRRSDIFSLGVILYEMLTGERPFRGERQMLISQILSEDPPPPRRLNQRIPKDLETICLKCLEKRPERRYATASVLAGDLQAWRDKRPIEARPVGRIGRMIRWCQRRPAVASLIAVVVAITITGFVLVSWQAGVARRQARLASQQRDRAQSYLEKLLESVDQMLVEVGASRLKDEPHMAETRRALIDEALAFYDWLSAQDSDSDTIGWLHAKALVQAGTLRRYLGNQDERARESLELAEAILARELSQRPLDAALRGLQAEVHLEMAFDAENQGRDNVAAGRARRAIQSVESIPPEVRQTYLPTLGDAKLLLANKLHRVDSNPAAAELLLEETIALFEETREHGNQRHTRVLIKAHHDLALLLATRAGSRDAAERHFQDAFLLADATEDTSVADRQRLLALLGDYASFLTRLDRDDDAERLWMRAREIRERLIAEHPTVPEHHFGLAMYFQSHGYFGFFRELSNDTRDEDAQHAVLDRLQGEIEEAIRILEELAARYPQSNYAQVLSNTHGLLGNVYSSRGYLSEAESMYVHRAAYLETRLVNDSDNALWNHEYASVLTNIANLKYRQKEYGAGLEHTNRAMEFERKALALQPDNIQFHVYYRNQISARVNCLMGLERWDEGEASLDDNVAESERVFDALPNADNRRHYINARFNRGRCRAARAGLSAQQYELARADVVEAIELKPNDEDRLYSQAFEAAVTLRLGDPSELLAWAAEHDAGNQNQEWPFVWAFIGVAHAQSGNFDAAKNYLERAERQLDEQSAPLLKHLVALLVSEARTILEGDREPGGPPIE